MVRLEGYLSWESDWRANSFPLHSLAQLTHCENSLSSLHGRGKEKSVRYRKDFFSHVLAQFKYNYIHYNYIHYTHVHHPRSFIHAKKRIIYMHVYVCTSRDWCECIDECSRSFLFSHFRRNQTCWAWHAFINPHRTSYIHIWHHTWVTHMTPHLSYSSIL